MNTPSEYLQSNLGAGESIAYYCHRHEFELAAEVAGAMWYTCLFLFLGLGTWVRFGNERLGLVLCLPAFWWLWGLWWEIGFYRFEEYVLTTYATGRPGRIIKAYAQGKVPLSAFVTMRCASDAIQDTEPQILDEDVFARAWGYVKLAVATRKEDLKISGVHLPRRLYSVWQDMKSLGGTALAASAKEAGTAAAAYPVVASLANQGHLHPVEMRQYGLAVLRQSGVAC